MIELAGSCRRADLCCQGSGVLYTQCNAKRFGGTHRCCHPQMAEAGARFKRVATRSRNVKPTFDPSSRTYRSSQLSPQRTFDNMAQAGLADLFSGASPSPPRPPRSPTPRSPSPAHRESLFLSPSDTPVRPRRSSVPLPSPPAQPSFQVPRTDAADTNVVDNFDDVQFDPGYDPLDLSAAYGEADEARSSTPTSTCSTSEPAGRRF